MIRRLLSGNEAIALGAYQAGVALAAAYPGTPSTEILENVAQYDGVYAEWAPNEKVALEVATGASYAGARAMASMKHVGLNVAADPFFAVAVTGVRGGLVVVSADDPSMHSSQGEQDNRHYAPFAKVPLLEPADSQEAYELTRLAFELSERFDTPVLLRTTTRVSHGKSVVEFEEAREERPLPPRFAREPEKLVMIPAYARRRRVAMEERLARLADYAETFPHNRLIPGDPRLGVISSGIAYQYAREVFTDATFLKLALSYPLPNGLVTRLAHQVERLIVVEELDPFLEDAVRALGISAEGKRYFPNAGELSVEAVEIGARKAGLLARASSPSVGAGLGRSPLDLRTQGQSATEPCDGGEAEAASLALLGAQDGDEDGTSPASRPSADRAGAALGMSAIASAEPAQEARHDGQATAPPLPVRPPVLCPGCPHTAAFYALKRLGFYRGVDDPTLPAEVRPLAALRRTGVVVTGDIGCYTLAVLPPLLAIDTTGCMGASIGNALGLEKAGLRQKTVAVIGDSTFLHSGITPLLDVVYNGGSTTTVILDNLTTAMTGHQEHPGTGVTAKGVKTRATDLERLVRGLGVDDVQVVNAFDLEAIEDALRRAVEGDQPSVVIVRGPCILKERGASGYAVVEQQKCDGCAACVRTGCPAVGLLDGKARIDPTLCVGSRCGVCVAACPQQAVSLAQPSQV